MRRIKQQRNLTGAYGTLGELLKAPDKVKTAVEVTAGASLFHYVVDNDRTASQLVEILQWEKAGRITFMPLSKLQPKPANIPKANDAIEMISKLEFDPKFEKAFQQVFGKTIICPNLQIASQYARSHGVNAITPSGDRSDKKGALSGGYVDPRSSRLDAIGSVFKWRTEFESHRARADEIRRELEAKDQEVTRAHSELQKAEHRRAQSESSYGPLQQEFRGKHSDLRSKRDMLQSKLRTQENVEKTTNDLNEQQGSYEAEISSDFKKTLSKSEEHQLDDLNNRLPDLRKKLLESSDSRANLEAQKSTLEVELQENLQPRLEQLDAHEYDADSGTPSSKLNNRQKDLKAISKKLDNVEKRLHEIEGQIEKDSAQLNQLHDRRNNKMREQEEIARAIEKFQRRMEKGMATKSLATERLAEVTRNIRELGALPEEAFSKYTKVSSEQVSQKSLSCELLLC